MGLIMSNSRLIITWQPMLSDHQAFTFEELGRVANSPVKAFVLMMEDATRRSQGWTDTRVASIDRQLIPAKNFLRFCYQHLTIHKDDVHFFGSAFGHPKMMLCLLFALWIGVEFYLVSEPYAPVSAPYFGARIRFIDRVKAILRPFLYRLYFWVLRSRTSGVFAISRRALAQFRRAGLSTEKLYPFGYFIPPLASENILVRETHTVLRLVFVGSLIPIKGLNCLIDAVKLAPSLDCAISLDVFGPGDPSAFELDRSIAAYKGKISFGAAPRVMASYDLLVVPSAYDGWGVVVNEALSVGVPVICSDQVGAAVLITTFGAGATFPAGDSIALANLFSELSKKPHRLQSMQSGCRTAAAAIHPAIAARYMWDVVNAPPSEKAKLASPWY